VKDKSVVLEEYATRLVSAEAVHLREMEFNKEGKSAISVRVVSARGGDRGFESVSLGVIYPRKRAIFPKLPYRICYLILLP
jgi:hypothetical protein